jgi:carbamoyltransferase
VNKIKNREWYRPFAAMVLKEDATDYFDMMGLDQSKFMTVSFDATEKAKLTVPGIIHVDGTCRIQTIDESDGIIFELLTKFKEKTGVGILLNTSFNLAGKPLVDNVNDAIETLNNSKLDYVWFADQNLLRGKIDQS